MSEYGVLCPYFSVYRLLNENTGQEKLRISTLLLDDILVKEMFAIQFM